MLFDNDLEFQSKFIQVLILTHGSRNKAYDQVCDMKNYCRFLIEKDDFKTQADRDRYQDLYEFWDAIKTHMDVD